MNSKVDTNSNKKVNKTAAILKFSILILLLIGIPLYIYLFQKEWLQTFSTFSSVKEYFETNKSTMMITYIFAQAIQIIVCFIPGQWLQIVSGYFYGVPLTFGLSILGAILGSVITYYLAKILGRDAIHLFFGEEKVTTLINRLNSKKAFIIIFIIFLIPGVPKDLCNYAAGLSDMKLKPFILISLLGRSPAMLGSIIIGRQLYTKEYTVVVIVALVAILFFTLGIIYRKKINNYLDSLYDKYIVSEGAKHE